MEWLILAAALGIGALLAGQVGVNASLGKHLGQPVLAALASFSIGTLALFIYALVARLPWPAPSSVTGFPWWVWLGGLMGAVYVTASVILAPRLGVAVFTALVVAGQLVAALVMDHYGWLGMEELPVTPGRLVGALLLAAGVVLMKMY